MDEVLALIGEEIADPDEECFYLFSGDRPGDLGIIEPKSDILDVTVAGNDFTIRQSPTKLVSSRDEGTTGAGIELVHLKDDSSPLLLTRSLVAWRASVLFAEWLARIKNPLFGHGLLHQDSTVLELGAGVSAIVALVVGPRVKRYIATDQNYVLKLLKQNLEENLPKQREKLRGTQSATTSVEKGRSKREKPGKAPPGTRTSSGQCHVDVLSLDWERDSLEGLLDYIEASEPAGNSGDRTGIDVVVACDCIFNEALVKPFVETCRVISSFRSGEERHKPTICIIAQQLRSPEVFEHWITETMRHFRVWRVRVAEEPPQSGLVIHVAVLKMQQASSSTA